MKSINRNGLFLGRGVCGGLFLLPLCLPASGQIAVQNQGFVPFSDAPINYRSEVHDPIADLQKRLDRATGVNGTDLFKWFDVSSYLTPHSDIVAQLVLAHQTQAHNLITITRCAPGVEGVFAAAKLVES